MTDIAINAHSRGSDIAIGTAWFATVRDGLGARYRRWRTYRSVKAELEQYEPEELADFGVAEADIDRVAHEAARL